MVKIVFFGTPEYVLPVLERINREFRENNKSPIVAVVTQKPKPSGRKQKLEYSAIDRWAHERKVKTYYDAIKLMEDGIEADLGILAAYGAILPEKLIKYFPKGIINIHPSLLPKFRGASPVQGQILEGVDKTGATIIKLDALMDHGPIIAQFEEAVNSNDTTETLRVRLFEKSTEVLSETIAPYLSGKIKPKEQEHDKASFTRLIKKEYGHIPSRFIKPLMAGEVVSDIWEIGVIKDYAVKPTADLVVRLSKALVPWPGLWTTFKNNGKERRLKILEVSADNDKLLINKVQIEGKTAVNWSEFMRGYPQADFS